MVKVIKTLSLDEQIELVRVIKANLKQAPLFDKHMPRSGIKFNYRCSSLGQYGWYSDKDNGYRYEEKHPHTNEPFPPIPPEIMKIVEAAKVEAEEPYFVAETCLVNSYSPKGTLGYHQDNTEDTLKPMIISVSLGDSMDFHYCSSRAGRLGEKTVLRLHSGDVLVFSGPDRMIWHGVPKPCIPGTGPTNIGLKPGRVNLTIRQVKPYSVRVSSVQTRIIR